MKKNISLFISIIFFASCSSWQRIGTFTMVSTRNIETSKEYKELQRNVEGRDDEKVIGLNSQGNLKKSYHGRLDAAVDNATAKVAGGEFMKNVQISSMDGRMKVVGDIWGTRPDGYISPEEKIKRERERVDKENETKAFEKEITQEKKKAVQEQQKKLAEEQTKKRADTFKVGDKVTFQAAFKMKTGTITGKDTNFAAIKVILENGQEKIEKVAYSNLTKIEK